MAAPPALLAGRYDLGHLLGAGGMAVVHRAHDHVLDRDVAVKLLPPGSDAAAVARFRAEGRRHAAVRHPGVVPVLDAGSDAGWHFLVLELAGGGSLAQLLRRRPALPAEHVAALVGQVADALAAAHRAGVVHRDVKPGNVLLDDEGRARLTDFGISLGAGDLDGLPADQVLGTREYLSPERLRGAPATPVDDVWAVGVLGHQLLTGVRPDAGLPVLPATVPAGLAAALTAAVDPDPCSRPADGGALAALLARAPVVGPPPLLVGELLGDPAGDPSTGDASTRPLATGPTGGGPRRAAAVLTGCVLLGGALATAFPASPRCWCADQAGGPSSSTTSVPSPPSTPAVPPEASAVRRAMSRPSPVEPRPETPRSTAAVACTPGPRSATARRAPPPGRAATATENGVPGGVCAKTLPSRASTAAARSAAGSRTGSGPGARSTSRTRSSSSASTDQNATRSATTATASHCACSPSRTGRRASEMTASTVRDSSSTSSTSRSRAAPAGSASTSSRRR